MPIVIEGLAPGTYDELRVKIGEPVKGAGRQYLVANAQLQDYRAVLLELDYAPGKPVTLRFTVDQAFARVIGARRSRASRSPRVARPPDAAGKFFGKMVDIPKMRD